MNYINDVSINEAVIHVLDTNSNSVIYDEIGLNLNDEIYEYIYKHILKCLNDEELRYGVFNTESAVKIVSQDYLKGSENLITVSKILVDELFNIMKSNGEIPSCDLLVASISTEYGPMLAILKMDYVKNYTHAIEKIENHIGVNIVPQFLDLPSGSIKKAVFINPLKKEKLFKFDLMIIDRRPNKSNEDESSYFLDYIGCSIINNERDLTKSFIKAAGQWVKNNLKDDAETAERTRSLIRRKLNEEEDINIDNLSSEISNGADESFAGYLKQAGIEKDTIPLDKHYIDKKLVKKKIKVDKDISLSITEEAYNDTNRFEVKHNGDGTIDFVIKNIRNYTES